MSTETQKVDVLLKVTFDQQGDFAAIDAARKWCADRGISVGSMQRDDPMGLMVGDYFIAKWRNLNARERKQLDETITGDKRNGPVLLTIKREALARIGGAA